MAESPQDALFDLAGDAARGADAAAEPAAFEGPLGFINRHEHHVAFVAGVLAQHTWGDPPAKGRPKPQKDAATEAARRAFGYLNETGL